MSYRHDRRALGAEAVPVTDFRMVYNPPVVKDGKVVKSGEFKPPVHKQTIPWLWVGAGVGVLLVVGGIAYVRWR